MRGRPRKPTALQKLKNAGKRPGYDASQGRGLEPKWNGDGSLPPPPEHLSPEVREAWLMLAAPLRFKIFSDEDVTAFHSMVRMWSEWNAASNHVMEHGQVATNRHGEESISPQMRVFMDLSTKLLNFYARFGMTPADRSRVAAKPEKEVNPDAEFSA